MKLASLFFVEIPSVSMAYDLVKGQASYCTLCTKIVSRIVKICIFKVIELYSNFQHYKCTAIWPGNAKTDVFLSEGTEKPK